MKIKIKFVVIAFAIVSLSFLLYTWLSREEWQENNRCADCALMDNDTLQRLVGTVEIEKNGKWLFTDRLTNLNYHLVPCDANCGRDEVTQFDKINPIDPTTKKQLYFDIEGKYIKEKDQFQYRSTIFMNERIFLNPEKIKDLTFEEISEKYTVLEEETFKLNESHYAGLREFLPHYFSMEQLKQPILLKEVTWETSDSTLITIWFIKKQNRWLPIETYEWKKGTEF
ncbi:hypothetical protein J2X31_002198 [Flavobacterium arsenatis]|uniref:Uncharacterized protein n=1 Tax=Flavobacterium arsenatis TaxID=1484332 RepID=A0ABU1TR87_9FLAO|nr:hypothetical protein [Flavobacterium arsenatis]MDR6968183.1 hypothetical protein [Flavobacterium arsenatis]